MIYFIQAGKNGPIKIGYTNKTPEDRLRTLQTGNPAKLALIGSIEGDKEKEASLHKMFEPYREFGEWFESNETVMGYLFYLLFGVRLFDIDTDTLSPLNDLINDYEKTIISNRLRHFKGNVSKTAKSLQINMRTAWRKIKTYKLPIDDFRRFQV